MIKNASTEYDGELVLYSAADTENAWFRFMQDESGLYQIVNAKSNRAIGIKDGSLAVFAPIVQHNYPDKNIASYDKWHIVKKSRYYMLLNANSGDYMITQGDSSADLTPIVQACNGVSPLYLLEPVGLSKRMHFSSSKAVTNEEGVYDIVRAPIK